MVIAPDIIVRDVAAPWSELMLRLARAPGAFFLRHREQMYCGAFPAEFSSAVLGSPLMIGAEPRPSGSSGAASTAQPRVANEPAKQREAKVRSKDMGDRGLGSS